MKILGIILVIIVIIGIFRMLVRMKSYDGIADFMLDLFMLDLIFGDSDDDGGDSDLFDLDD